MNMNMNMNMNKDMDMTKNLDGECFQPLFSETFAKPHNVRGGRLWPFLPLTLATLSAGCLTRDGQLCR